MPIYNQRWLREHQAVPTEVGWIRPTTGELLKCQKGIEYSVPEQPIFKSAKYGNLPDFVVIDPITRSGSFTFDYTINEPDYEPISIVPSSFYSTPICEYEVLRDKKKIQVNVSDVRYDGQSNMFYLHVEGQSATTGLLASNTVYFSIDYPDASINKVVPIGNLDKTIYIYKSTGNRASSYFSYRVYDTIVQYEKSDVEVEILDYTGESTITTIVKSWSSITNIVDILSTDGKLKDGETFKVNLKVKNIPFTEQIKFTVKSSDRYLPKPFEEMTDEDWKQLEE